MNVVGDKRESSLQRNSGVELLRIICIIGIIGLHLWDDVLYSDYDLSKLNQVFRIFHNSAFGCANTCFVLITGYFGANCKLSKIVCIDFAARFYDIVFYVVAILLGAAFSLKSVVLTLFPFFTENHWFISVYIGLLIISPFLNWITEKIDVKNLKKVIITFVILCWTFSFFPEFSSIADGGNGITYFSVMYLLGRYINLYGKFDRKRSFYGFWALGILMLIFCGNIILSILAGNAITWLSGNNPLPIILAVFLLVFAVKSPRKLKCVNFFSANVLGVYLLETGIRIYIIPLFFNIEKCASEKFFVFYFILECISIFVLANIIEFARRFTLGKIDLKIGKFLENKVIFMKENMGKR